jgi:hypothetical protein
MAVELIFIAYTLEGIFIRIIGKFRDSGVRSCYEGILYRVIFDYCSPGGMRGAFDDGWFDYEYGSDTFAGFGIF